MSPFIWILLIIVFALIVFSLVYTIYIAKNQAILKGEFDTKIDKKVQRHPYIRNPIFIALGVAAAIMIGYIFYMMAIFY